MYDIVGKRNWYFAFSALITIPGLIFIVLGGLRPSVDFTGGTVWQVRYADEPSADEVRAALVELGHPDATVRDAGDGFLEIRTEPIGLAPPPTPIPEGTEFDDLHDELQARFGPAEPRSISTVGPLIGSGLISSSIILIVVGELFILAYLWIRFGFRFGTAAIVALLHDVIVVVGFFAILGWFFDVEFDALFVTALLTVVGFSVHDTIVVFDRIRENRIRHAGEPFGAIVNHSILQTMGRSIITSLTVVVTLGALVLLGPPTIRTFALALLLGVVSGTYSSIFNASQILVAWHEWDARRRARPARA